MERNYLLGIDVGSSSVKASLVDAATGVSVASAFYPKTEAEIIAVRNGWAEQDPESWWENTKLAVRKARELVGEYQVGSPQGDGRCTRQGRGHSCYRHQLPDARLSVC